MEYVTLNNGVKMPQIGYGVLQVSNEQCESIVADALKAGYRLIDTAQAYYNEEAVGRAVKNSGIAREDIFLTTKIWPTAYEEDKARASVLESMKKLQVEYIDLVLLHQCVGNCYAAYRALEGLYEEGLVKAIGVSNFSAERLADLCAFNKVTPAVN